MPQAIAQGFDDPPLEAQAVFRNVLDAMAHPSRIETIDGSAALKSPGRLNLATFAIALTLLDFETSVWLDEKLDADLAVVEALRFHCGCPITEDPGGASFALIADASMAPPLSVFHQGTPEYPDRSTTVMMQVRDFDDAQGAELAGPGIETEVRLTVDGGPPNFWQQWSANQRQFPLGVDLILTAGNRMAALPRSISAEI